MAANEAGGYVHIKCIYDEVAEQRIAKDSFH